MKMYAKRLMQVMGLLPCLKVCKSYICHALGLYADTYINTIFVNKAWLNQGLKK